MITLYGVLRSRASRPGWLLYEAGAAFTHVPVIQAWRLKGAGGEVPLNTASPAFLRVNPMGQIPALVDGALVLTESLAITLHLARTVGGALGPRDVAEAALMEQWAFFAASAIEVPALEIASAERDGTMAAPEGRSIVALAAQTLRRPLARVEAHLAGAGQMVGGRFTVADINLAESVRYAQGHPTLLDAFPAVKAWLEACQSRPAFRKMWAARMAEAA